MSRKLDDLRADVADAVSHSDSSRTGVYLLELIDIVAARSTSAASGSPSSTRRTSKTSTPKAKAKAKR